MRFCSRSSDVVVQVSACWLVRNYHVFGSELVMIQNTVCFIMFSVITNTYNRKTKGPTITELLTATGTLKKKVSFLETRDVRCVHRRWHGTHRYDIQVLATHTRQHGWIDILHCCNDACLQISEVTWQRWDEYPVFVISPKKKSREDVSYGLPIVNFYNPGVHYETTEWGRSKHNCLVSYLLWRQHVSATVGHLQVTKVCTEENYTEYDHSIQWS